MTAVRVKADKKKQKNTQLPFRFSLSLRFCAHKSDKTQVPLDQTEKKGVCEWQLFHSPAWNQSAHHKKKRDSWDRRINTDKWTTTHTTRRTTAPSPSSQTKPWVSASVINDPAPEAANSTVYPRVYIFYRSKGQLSKTPAIWQRRGIHSFF